MNIHATQIEPELEKMDLRMQAMFQKKTRRTPGDFNSIKNLDNLFKY